MKYLFAILFIYVQSFSQQLSPTEVLDKVREKYLHMSDISADFSQSVKLRYKQSGQKISGSAQLKKGNKYRIETDQQTIVTDGKKVWMFTPSTKQVLIDNYKANRQPFSPDKFLTGLPKDFSPSALDKENDRYILSLEPSKTTSVSSMMVGVKVWVHPESWLVERIDYNDKNGTVTSIVLSNIKFNKGIPDKNFLFEITADMKIVDVNSLKQ